MPTSFPKKRSPTFKAKTVEARLDVMSTERLCFSCLKKEHWSRRCRSARRCSIEGCRFQHHPLLHHSKSHAETDEDAPRKQEGARSTPFLAASIQATDPTRYCKSSPSAYMESAGQRTCWRCWTPEPRRLCAAKTF